MASLQALLEGTDLPFVTALILGLMTAFSPCPLTTNITAIGYISRDMENKTRIFTNGLWYTLGRVFGYSSLGLILYYGASRFHLARFFQTYGERFLGPLLILVGLLMLDLVRLNLPGVSGLAQRFDTAGTKGKSWMAFFLGLIFSLAFCPYSGALFFGMLIPLAISSPSGLALPIVFAVATSLPVIVVAYLLAFSMAGLANFFNRVQSFEKWFRKGVALLFIGAGLYYMAIYFF